MNLGGKILMKKILLLFSLSLCVFSLTACFKSKPKKETLVESYDEENDDIE